jgi:hypothetical protein
MKEHTPSSEDPTPDLNGERAARRKLPWVLGLLVSLAALAGTWLFQNAQAAREPLTTLPRMATLPSQRAAQLLVAGEMTHARKELLAALANKPDDAAALLVLACLELEENHHPEAREVITRLQAVLPERPEPKLLELLLAHRQRARSSSLGQAFIDAWAALGRPDFEHSPLLPDADSSLPDDLEAEEAAWRRANSAASRLTLLLASETLSEERASWLLQQVPTLDEPALLAAVSDTLSRHTSLPPAFRQEAAPALRQRLARLVEATPHSMQPRLLLLLVGTEAPTPFSARDLEELDALSTLPSWRDTSYTRTFQEARQHLRELGVPAPTERALLVAGRSTGSSSALLLLRRAEATGKQLSEDERRWMGRMLWRIGTRLADSSSYLEHTVGLLLMESGAEDLNDRCGEAEASTRQDELSASVLASYKAALDRWPLPSLRREMEEARARHEANWLRAWLGKTTLP